MRKTSKNKYTEPTDFIPKEIRKELGLGEYNTDVNNTDDKNIERENANNKLREVFKGK